MSRLDGHRGRLAGRAVPGRMWSIPLNIKYDREVTVDIPHFLRCAIMIQLCFVTT